METAQVPKKLEDEGRTQPWEALRGAAAPDVRLLFDDGTALGAHSQILQLASTVLREFFSSRQEPGPAPLAGGGAGVVDVPVPGDAKADWELVLGMLYPMLPPPYKAPVVNWDNAESVLLLADKWGIEAVAAVVEALVTGSWPEENGNAAPRPCDLAGHMKWLSLASRTGRRSLFAFVLGKLVDAYKPRIAVSHGASIESKWGQLAASDVRRSLQGIRHEGVCLVMEKLLALLG